MADFDCAIIGSGTAGGVLAHFLTEGGLKCIILEAGKEYHAGTYPESELEGTSELYWNGGMDLSQDGQLVLLRAKCVGGGSIINQCLLDRLDQSAFTAWKDASGMSFFSEEAMTPHYEAIEAKLSIQQLSRERFNQNTEVFVRGFEALGYGWTPLRRGQTDCGLEMGNDCIGCLIGCHRDSKQSIPVVFLPKAKERGLEVRTGCLVDRVIPDGGRSGFRSKNSRVTRRSRRRLAFSRRAHWGAPGFFWPRGFKKTSLIWGEGSSAIPKR